MMAAKCGARIFPGRHPKNRGQQRERLEGEALAEMRQGTHGLSWDCSGRRPIRRPVRRHPLSVGRRVFDAVRRRE